MDVPVGVRIRDSHPLADRDVVGPAELEEHQLVMFPRHAGPAQFDRIVGVFGGPERPGGIHEIALLGAARTEMMRALDDHSFTVGPLALHEDDGAQGILARPLDPPDEPARLWLVWHHEPHAPLDALIAHVRARPDTPQG